MASGSRATTRRRWPGGGGQAAEFGTADHDPVALRDRLGPIGVAGFFAAGEVGPVAGHDHVHGFPVSVLVFSG